MAKILIIVGLSIAALGVLVWFAQFLPENLRPFNLPGDIRIERDGFKLYVPITTMILISLLGTGVLWLIRFFSGGSNG